MKPLNLPPLDNHDTQAARVVVVGGGAAGFAAIACKESNGREGDHPEGAGQPLRVRISGGGRCNVTTTSPTRRSSYATTRGVAAARTVHQVRAAPDGGVFQRRVALKTV